MDLRADPGANFSGGGKIIPEIPAAAPLPAVISAVISIGLIRSGVSVFVFLCPLGIMAYCYNAKTAWLSALLMTLGNGLLSLVLVLFFSYGRKNLALDVFYFTVMAVIFTWITAPPFRGPRFLRIPAVYRLITGAVLASLVFAPVLYRLRSDPVVYDYIKRQAEALSSLYAGSAGADTVQRALMEGYFTSEFILETLESIALRGGVVISSLLFFFISRQISLAAAWIARRIRPGGNIAGFHVESRCIWVLSCSLLAILFGLWIKITLIEVIAWNILVVCIILYLVQGGGILAYFLSGMAIPPLFRFGLVFLIVLVFFSPGINAFALGAVVLLGIAENWVPFRAPKPNGPSSTPGI
jgi:hypothetical protein